MATALPEGAGAASDHVTVWPRPRPNVFAGSPWKCILGGTSRRQWEASECHEQANKEGAVRGLNLRRGPSPPGVLRRNGCWTQVDSSSRLVGGSGALLLLAERLPGAEAAMALRITRVSCGR